MRILIDHGRSESFGDEAMVLSTVGGMQEIAPNATLCVSEDGLWGSELLGRSYVETIPLYHISTPWSDPFVQAQPQRNVKTSSKAALWRWVKSPLVWPALNAVRAFQRHMYAATWQKVVPIHTLKCVTKSSSESLLHWCDQFDAGCIAGGIVTDEFCASLYRQCMLMHAFHELGKPFYVLSVQYGPFNNAKLRRRANIAMSKATAATVRYKNLPDDIQTKFMPDMSAGLSTDHEADTWLAELGLTPGKYIAYHNRSSFYNPRMRKYARKYAKILRIISNTLGMPLLHVPISLKESDDDRTWGRKVADFLPDVQHFSLEDVQLSDTRRIKAVFGKAYGVLGVSYHACQFALSEGVPAVSVSAGNHYKFKADGIAATYGDNRLAINIAKQSAEELAAQCLTVFNDVSARGALQTKAKQFEREWAQLFRDTVSFDV